jgi:hypothetical protein
MASVVMASMPAIRSRHLFSLGTYVPPQEDCAPICRVVGSMRSRQALHRVSCRDTANGPH